jgi:CheY-like chemotaxis protein
MLTKITIVIADDHPVFRQGLREIVECDPDLQILGEASDGQAALDMIKELKPDVAVLDVNMPKLKGFDVAREIQRAELSVGVIFLTMYDDERMFNQALNVGAKGYLLKDSALNGGLASSRCDFTAVFGTLSFAANETQKTLVIPINRDSFTEGPEVFRINLANPTGGAVLTTPSSPTITVSDSVAPAANAIDDTATFVRQQYHDFLNREPDAAGLAFWIDNIDKCNDPARRPPDQTATQCIEVQRINTSAAFFLSIEFLQSGGMVRDFYVATLDRPLTNNMPAFVEFIRDTQAVQRGIVVGQPGWEVALAANRSAFMNDFVMRAEFVGQYPATDTPSQYVDKLIAHAAVSLTSAERSAAIAEFGLATTAADPGARGRALSRITKNAAFQAREFNRAFVYMQYLGYLRRDPNAAPDTNFNGYNFWLNKLIQFNGNYIDAEMVKAFISSAEYRGRFGP